MCHTGKYGIKMGFTPVKARQQCPLVAEENISQPRITELSKRAACAKERHEQTLVMKMESIPGFKESTGQHLQCIF